LTKIAAVILAAGGSTRFGQPKQMLDWDGQPLVAHVADIAMDAGLDPVIVVLGHEAERIQALLGTRPVQIVMNWRWEDGLSTSMQAGLVALPPDTEAAVFLQCDQPLIGSALLAKLVAHFELTDASIVFPSHAGQRSSPTLFARELFSELAVVTGDIGGRATIARHSDKTATFEVTDPDILADIDTPDDYKALLNKISGYRISTATGTGSSVGTAILRKIRHLVIDMDGVLWHGEMPMDGIDDFFAFLREEEIGFILATNNSTRTPEQYTEKLACFGVDVPPSQILNSSEATAAYLSSIAPQGAKVYPVGEEGVRRALEKHGFEIAEDNASYVVVGWKRDLTWNHLATASLLIHNGAKFIGTNPDTSFPTERGPVPGNGAQLAAIETTTGIKPIVVGKPEPEMYLEALRRLDATPVTTAVIGDRLDTDILGGVRTNLTGILVLSGITTEEDVARSMVKPDIVCADIVELTQIWREQLDVSAQSLG